MQRKQTTTPEMLLLVLFLISLLLIVLFLQTTRIGSTTTVVQNSSLSSIAYPPNGNLNATIFGLLSNFTMNPTLMPIGQVEGVAPLEVWEPPAKTVIISKYFTANNAIVNSQAFNYSSLNQSKPFGEYVNVLYLYTMNYSELTRFRNAYYANHSFFAPHHDLFKDAMVGNAPISISGTQGFLIKATNFTNRGFADYQILYIGNKPNVSLYYVTVLYKNLRIIVGEWGFSNSINATELFNYTAKVIGAIKKVY